MARSRSRWKGGGGMKHPRVSWREQVYKPSTLRFIPKTNEVPRVLIHLLSLIFHRHASRLRANSMAMTAMSDSLCIPLLMCSTTGDLQSSNVRCHISDYWCSYGEAGLSHLHWRPHLLHVIKNISLEGLQEVRNFTLNTFPVVRLENLSVTSFTSGCSARVVTRWLMV